MLVGVKYENITDKGLVITDKQQWFRTIEADTIVVACGLQPNRGLLRAVEGKAPEVYLVGDCAEPCGILEAIHDGYRTGCAI